MDDKVTDAEYAKFIARTGYEIFEPLTQPCLSLIIATWGISPVATMKPVLDRIQAPHVGLLVGFSKQTHNLTMLYKTLSDYCSFPHWHVRILPGFHIKAWVVVTGERVGSAYMGSCNFARETVVNEMIPGDFNHITKMLGVYWKQASAVSKSTSLQKVRPVRMHHNQLKESNEEFNFDDQ